MKINWKVRFANKTFWVTIIPALFICARTILSAFGVDFDLTDIQTKIMTVVDAVFAILAATGVVVDMTTVGIGDSKRALTYETPAK